MSRFQVFGEMAQVFDWLDGSAAPPEEAITVGPAGTGKTRMWMEVIHCLCASIPNLRVLMVRKTRVSLSESALQIFEDWVLGANHPILQNGPSRENRRKYVYPNGSEIVLGGMDKPTKLFSTEYDVIYVCECNELALGEWESLHRALRHGHWTPPGAEEPVHVLVGDTNPDSPYHWILQRFKLEKALKIQTWQWDNPSMTDGYLRRMRKNLTGARLARLYYGEWVGSEGLVWETYDPAFHLVSGGLTEQTWAPGRWKLTVEQSHPVLPRHVELRWFIAGMDFGYTNPGAFVVFGFDDQRRAFKVAEVYRRGWSNEQWAERIAFLYKEFQFVRIVCDSAEPDRIRYLNDHLGGLCGRDLPRIAVPCKKGKGSKLAGVDLVRGLWRENRLFLLRDTIYEKERDLGEEGLPMGLEEEIQGWTIKETVGESGKPEERPDDDCADHGCDATIYALTSAFGKDFSQAPGEILHPADSLNHAIDDPVSLARRRQREAAKKRAFGRR